MIHRSGFSAILVLTVVGAAGVSCAEPPENRERTSAEADAAIPTTGSPEAAPTRAALPGLFDIMLGLQRDMARIDRGLWLAQFDTVAAGAESIATHPQVQADELKVVRAALGDEVIRFKELDTRVHDLAVQLERDAEAADMEAVLATHAELRNGCIACHQTFRDKIRSGVRATTDGVRP